MLAKRARLYLKQHFGSSQGLTNAFPCMRDHYRWGDHRPDVPDPRIPTKNSTEYHGLESLAAQYQAMAMYDLAANHWLLACRWRREDRDAHSFDDPAHNRAIAFCLSMFAFNEALHGWSSSGAHGDPPDPVAWKLDADRVAALEHEGEATLLAAQARPRTIS